MNKYIGITIGAIIKTLSMARKPRELWSSSYLFSYLMETLRAGLPKEIEIFSPAENKSGKNGVGLYPDRMFCKYPDDKELELGKTISDIKAAYAKDLGIDADYFNVYAVVLNAESDSLAIKKLNEKLDFLELYNTAVSEDAEKTIRELIFNKESFRLFKIDSDKTKFLKSTLAQISSAQLADKDGFKYDLSKWEDDFKKEDALIKILKDRFCDEFITPHKYICVVHADGDNMGNIVTHPLNNIAELSGKLIEFASEACEIIKVHKGMPIYAGGDDLLFISPVITGENTTIFDLIKDIDKLYDEKGLTKYKGKKNGKETTTSMSYGISITYYKYPLYEALNMSRSLLFDVAKNVENKDAIAWSLQKNSGSAISGKLSKSNKKLYEAFEGLIISINDKIDNNLVTAVAHKIKASEVLLELFMEKSVDEVRLDAFFEKTLEYESKNDDEKKYLKAVRELFIEVCKSVKSVKSAVEIMYGMLRTAKFVKGLEEDKDE